MSGIFGSFKTVFTEAIKDTIGNEPVLDQFDTYYAASFYGTMQDSFITGAMLHHVSAPSFGLKFFVTGTRGKAFNKVYAGSQPPVDSTYGSQEVNHVPNLSYRLVPWKEKVSNSYRLTQCFDSQERYYDTCLPDINAAFAADGAAIWKISEPSILLTPASKASFFLSPYANVQNIDVGYMFFNSKKVDRTSQGLPSDKDPFVNNTWTWSFPYENRYSPEKRLLKGELIATVSTNLSSYSKSPEATSEYEIISKTFFDRDNYSFQDMENFWGIDVFDNFTLPRVQPTFKDINFLNASSQTAIKGFIPLLPGKHDNEIRNDGLRNSLRYFMNISGSLGKVSVPTAFQGNKNLDSSLGFSLLVPTDIKLDQKVSHEYLSPDPGPELLTGSMTYADTIKFLFGFGDLNNMAYGERELNAVNAYSEGFESYAVGTQDYNIHNYISKDLIVRWDTVFSRSTPPKTWQVIQGNYSPEGVDQSGQRCFYISGAIGPTSLLTGGIAWPRIRNLNTKVLMISGSADQIAFDPIAGYDYSSGKLCLDITSSYPWTFSYDRAVAGHSSDGLFVHFVSTPCIGGDFSSLFEPLLPIEFVRGKGLITGTHVLATMEKFDLRSSVSTDEYPLNIQNSIGVKRGFTYDYPLPPGEWRLCFSYIKSGSITTGPDVTIEDIAAIDNFQIFTWKESTFPPTSTIGGNNYPKFRSYKVDNRYNPITDGYNKEDSTTSGIFRMKDAVLSGSSDRYSGFAFGMSPIIRGWKYGLHSGFPSYSRLIFRRDRFGQFRDMLEQRQYTKFINVDVSPTDNDATTTGLKIKEREESDTVNIPATVLGLEKAPVEVQFVRLKYEVNDRSIGKIYAEPVSPYMTTSQNLSIEVTSSLPYFDGIARHRDENSMPNLKTT